GLQLLYLGQVRLVGSIIAKNQVQGAGSRVREAEGVSQRRTRVRARGEAELLLPWRCPLPAGMPGQRATSCEAGESPRSPARPPVPGRPAQRRVGRTSQFSFVPP